MTIGLILSLFKFHWIRRSLLLNRLGRGLARGLEPTHTWEVRWRRYIYLVAGHTHTTSNLYFLCLCTRFSPGRFWVNGKHPSTHIWYPTFTSSPKFLPDMKKIFQTTTTSQLQLPDKCQNGLDFAFNIITRKWKAKIAPDSSLLHS